MKTWIKRDDGYSDPDRCAVWIELEHGLMWILENGEHGFQAFSETTDGILQSLYRHDDEWEELS